jgi:hypothetical protein
MPEPGGHYKIRGSDIVTEMIRQIQRQAEAEGRGSQALAALHKIQQRLQQDPTEFGEANYRLSVLRVEVRTCVVAPLVVDFAVHMDQPLVFIKGVKLLSQ